MNRLDEKVQTFCCDSKDGTDGNMVGKNCHPSYTGQCNIGYGLGQNYKFRCLNPSDTTSVRDEISETYTPYMTGVENQPENCKYIRGFLGHVISGKGGKRKPKKNVHLDPN